MANSSLTTTAALVALGVSVAVAGYVWVEQRSGIGRQVSGLREDVATKGSELAALKARLDEASTGRRLLDEDVDRLRERMTRETESLGQLPGRVAALEQTIERFVGVGDKVRAAWLLAEAEHYMRIANAQLGLAGDVAVAQTALGLADDSLRELNDPRMTPVRRLLADEISSLRAVPRPDTEGIVLSLGSLSDSLETLRLKSSAQESFRLPPEKPAAPLTGFERALAATSAALMSLISVRRVDDPVSPLLSEAAQGALIRSLDLELQLARLAIMRGDSGMFRRSVEAASERLREDFDTASPDVEAAIDSLSELSATRLPDELPDISGSLDALLRINAAAKPATSPAAVANRGRR
jgi:uroporphyrin-3 C-methyltransferase